MEMKMDNFYEILDLMYKINCKHPELRFGQVLDSTVANEESIFYITNDELKYRLEELLKEE
jgi:hypothetical protein